MLQIIQQAPEKAKVYEQEEEIRELQMEIQQYKRRVDELFFEVTQSNSREDQLRKDRDNLLRVQAEVELRYDGYKSQLASLEEQLKEAKEDKTKTLFQFKDLVKEHGAAISACEDMITKLKSIRDEMGYLRRENEALTAEAERLRETHLVGIEELTPRPRLKERKEWEAGWSTEKKMEWLLKRCDGIVPGSSTIKPKKSQFRRETNFLANTVTSQASLLSPGLKDTRTEDEVSAGEKAQTMGLSSRKTIEKKGTVYNLNAEMQSGLTFAVNTGPQTGNPSKDAQEGTFPGGSQPSRFHININPANTQRTNQFASAPLNSLREPTHSPGTVRLGEQSAIFGQKGTDETPYSKLQNSFSKVYGQDGWNSEQAIENLGPSPEEITLLQLKKGQSSVMRAFDQVDREIPPQITRKSSEES